VRHVVEYTCLILLHEQFATLKTRIGDDQLGDYFKIMELTLLLEALSNKDELTEDEFHSLLH